MQRRGKQGAQGCQGRDGGFDSRQSRHYRGRSHAVARLAPVAGWVLGPQTNARRQCLRCRSRLRRASRHVGVPPGRPTAPDGLSVSRGPGRRGIAILINIGDDPERVRVVRWEEPVRNRGGEFTLACLIPVTSANPTAGLTIQDEERLQFGSRPSGRDLFVLGRPVPALHQRQYAPIFMNWYGDGLPSRFSGALPTAPHRLFMFSAVSACSVVNP